MTQPAKKTPGEYCVLRKSTLLADLRQAYEFIQSGRCAQGGAQIKMLHDWIKNDTYTAFDAYYGKDRGPR